MTANGTSRQFDAVRHTASVGGSGGAFAFETVPNTTASDGMELYPSCPFRKSRPAWESHRTGWPAETWSGSTSHLIRPRTGSHAPGSPWQNGFAERLIGSIRRECVDHIVVLGETHLRRILKSYARYYNETRTHRSSDKDAPILRPVQRTGGIISHALLGGLHHHYVRVWVFGTHSGPRHAVLRGRVIRRTAARSQPFWPRTRQRNSPSPA